MLVVYAVRPITVAGTAVPSALVVAYGTAIGVLVDLDHFLVARFKTGTWKAARFCLANPAAAVADQGRIFNRGDVGVLSRLLTHLLIVGVAVPSIAVASVSLAVVTCVVLYVHIVCDVAWDIQRRNRRTERPADDLARTRR